MEPKTLGEFVENESDEERRLLLESQIDRAEALSGRTFDHARIRGVSEMGEAAGRCHMCTREIDIREDMVKTETGIREDLAAVLVHEGEHAAGDSLEGFTELAVTLQTGKAPVPAYRTKVEHARHMAEVIGRKRSLELARKPEGRVLLLRAYVAEQVQRQIPAEEARREGEEHLQMAA
jgi:hypothetical protein